MQALEKEKDFLKGLFVDVSDNFTAQQQFKHLTLMEFLSAVYVCSTKNPMKIVKDILDKGLHQVLLFYCQMISGLMYDGIIKQMLKNALKLEEVNCHNFFQNILKLVHKSVKGVYDDDADNAFQLSIDIIMCLMNKNVIKKQFILSIVNQLRFTNVCFSNKVIALMQLLICDFEFNDMELKRGFENIDFRCLRVLDSNELKYIKYLASVERITLSAMDTTVRVIHEINECGNCEQVSIVNCTFQDENFGIEVLESSKMKWLRINSCKFNENSFKNLCTWVMASSVQQFGLWNMKEIETEWWSFLMDAVVNSIDAKAVSLRKLEILECTFLSAELKRKVIGFIPIQNYFM